MTNEEKITSLAALISPDTADEVLLATYITLSEGIVLNRRYPLGLPDGAKVPPQYEYIQLQIALELFAKRGAEGQIEHEKNLLIFQLSIATLFYQWFYYYLYLLTLGFSNVLPRVC